MVSAEEMMYLALALYCTLVLIPSPQIEVFLNYTLLMVCIGLYGPFTIASQTLMSMDSKMIFILIFQKR